MSDPNCAKCAFRAQYDRNPKSVLGRIWHWHAGWCPGWNRYLRSLDDEKRAELAAQYQLKKFM